MKPLIESVVSVVPFGEVCFVATLELKRVAAEVRTHPAVYYSDSLLAAGETVERLLARSVELVQMMPGD